MSYFRRSMNLTLALTLLCLGTGCTRHRKDHVVERDLLAPAVQNTESEREKSPETSVRLNQESGLIF